MDTFIGYTRTGLQRWQRPDGTIYNPLAQVCRKTGKLIEREVPKQVKVVKPIPDVVYIPDSEIFGG